MASAHRNWRPANHRCVTNRKMYPRASVRLRVVERDTIIPYPDHPNSRWRNPNRTPPHRALTEPWRNPNRTLPHRALTEPWRNPNRILTEPSLTEPWQNPDGTLTEPYRTLTEPHRTLAESLAGSNLNFGRDLRSKIWCQIKRFDVITVFFEVLQKVPKRFRSEPFGTFFRFWRSRFICFEKWV